MPASATQTEAIPYGVGLWTWEELLQSVEAKGEVDPLVLWKTEFKRWREDVQRFRTFETTALIEDDMHVLRRVHRGYLCHLLSQGERLGVLLIQGHKVTEDQVKQLGFIDEFLLNLRTTFDTWYSVEKRPKAENPLAAFA